MLSIGKKYNFKNHTGYNIFSNIIGNIFLFIPLGIYMALMPRAFQIKEVTAIFFSASCSIELIQHTFNLGVFDVDDIIYNSLGGITGYTLVKLKQSGCFVRNL